jgi:hypothetical protein
LTGSLRDAAELGGVLASHGRALCGRTGEGRVHARARGATGDAGGSYLKKLEEWVAFSRQVRADGAHEKLIALGYNGSEGTTRRAMAEAKGA